MELSAPDFERLSPYSGQLGDELSGMVREYAKQQRYSFMGPIKVHLEKADDLDTGLYRVRSRTLASSTSQTPERAPAAPAAPAAPTGPGPADRRPAAGGGYGYPQQPSSAPPMPAAPPPGGRAGGPAPVPNRPQGPGAGPLPGAQVRRWIEINGNRHQISRPTLVLGRSTDADVRIDDPGVSHAAL